MNKENNMDDLLLKVLHLKKNFPVKAGIFNKKSLILKAVNDISFELKRGEVLGLVGESGCGKTTLGRSLIRLYEPDEGRIFLDPEQTGIDEITRLDKAAGQLTGQIDEIKIKPGHHKDKALKVKLKTLITERDQLKKTVDQLAGKTDILSMDKRQLKKSRRRMQIVFQDPWASLNPRMLIKDIIAEGPKEFKLYDKKELERRVYGLIKKVGLPEAAAMRYPHEFSGGQRQRIGIARALALQPSLIICDEPVSALDVSVQAQILNLLISLQDEFDLTYIFIAHDLSVVQYISDRVAVMYLGKIVEIASATVIYDIPHHPYTISLMAAVPVADPDVKPVEVLFEGDVVSPVNLPGGCAFHTRCPFKLDICTEVIPGLTTGTGEEGHLVACHNPRNKVGGS